MAYFNKSCNANLKGITSIIKFNGTFKENNPIEKWTKKRNGQYKKEQIQMATNIKNLKVTSRQIANESKMRYFFTLSYQGKN